MYEEEKEEQKIAKNLAPINLFFEAKSSELNRE